MKKLRLLIIDDHAAVREALATRMRSSGRFAQVVTARSLGDGAEQATLVQPHVVLFELKGNDKLDPHSISAITAALAGRPVSIIILTSYADETEREAALQSGARRYLLKEINSDRLIAEIEAVAAETG